MVLFRNTSVLWYPGSWTVTAFFFFFYCLLHKKVFCFADSQAKRSLLLLLLLLPHTDSRPLAQPPVGNWWKIHRFSKRLRVRTGKSRFFVDCETLHTGKWALPSSHLLCWERGETIRFASAQQLSSLLTGEKYEASGEKKRKKKPALSSIVKSKWSKRGYFKCII